MPRYRFTQRYSSSYGAGAEGDEVDLTIDQAHDINRDAPGTLKQVRPGKEDEPEPETRAVEVPPSDRQVKRAPQKRSG